MYYDPNRNLVSVANSLLRHYGLKTFHPGDPRIDSLFDSLVPKRKKICVILLDGYGTAIQEIHRKDTPFLASLPSFSSTSVFPPTTTAATTSLLSGLYPAEHGWLAWTEQFERFSRPVTLFLNSFSDDGTACSPAVSDFLKYTSIIDRINRETEYTAAKVEGFRKEYKGNFRVFIKASEKCVATHDFSYLYWPNPDSLMHEYGTKSRYVSRTLSNIDSKLKNFMEAHREVCFLVLADHGHIDHSYRSLDEHQEMKECLRLPQFGLEPRCPAFYLKEEKKEEFLSLSKKYYADDFDIYTKEEVLKNRIFGDVKEENEHPTFRYGIGGVLWIAKGPVSLYQPNVFPLKSAHAGGTKQEMDITVSVFNKE